MNFVVYASDIQKVAIDIEQLPEFLNAKGSKVSQFVDLHLGVIITPNANHPIHSPASPASGNTDSDGDIRMGGINNLATTDARSMSNLTSLVAAAVVQALQSSNSGSHRSSRGQFKEDQRPFPPARTTQQRATLSSDGACERCAKKPSHRWGECEFRNFKDNPSRPGARRINNVITDAGNA